MDVEKNLKMYFEQQIDTIQEDIDFCNRKIENVKIHKRNHIPTRLAVVIVLIISLTGTGIVYGDTIVTYIKNLNFFHSNGDVAWSIETKKELGSYADIVDTNYSQLRLMPGQAVAIYTVENNPDEIIVCQQEPLVFVDVNEFNSYKINSLDYTFAPEILQDYEFHEGRVTFDTILPDNYSKLMKDEARATGKNVVVKNVETSSEVQSVFVDYYNKEDSDNFPSFTVQIVKWMGDELIEATNEEGMPTNHYEKIMLGESEVLYSELSRRKEIKWVASGYYYNVSSNQKIMTKEELLRITEALALKEE